MEPPGTRWVFSDEHQEELNQTGEEEAEKGADDGDNDDDNDDDVGDTVAVVKHDEPVETTAKASRWALAEDGPDVSNAKASRSPPTLKDFVSRWGVWGVWIPVANTPRLFAFQSKTSARFGKRRWST